MTAPRIALSILIAGLVTGPIAAQVQGPSTGSTPYVLPLLPGTETISVLTVDNTGANTDDLVPKVGGGNYGLAGLPDGMGAFDNGDGSFTLLLNHELGSGSGTIRAHGAIGAYVSKWTIFKNSLVVSTGEDLIKQVYGWNTGLQQSNATTSIVAFNRFCSADLPETTAFYNAATGLGSTARIFMNGEEGSATGWAQATVVTGPDAGKSYTLGKFNLTTNGSGLTGVGAWENVLASPYAQDKTVVIGTSDGGTGIMTNAVAVYVGTKTNTGTEADKAGLTNGTLAFVRVGAIAAEIANTTTRTTSITNGMAFSLSGTTSTTFSRPEDGAWNPADPKQFYFLTTDRLDEISDFPTGQIGRTRLWRLNFTDIANPALGGTIDLLVDGQTVGTHKVNMFDNMTVNRATGRLILQEDVGGAAHNGKIWEYDPTTFNGTTNSGVLTLIAKHDPARFGDRTGGVTTPATTPFNNDEESSGVIDITSLMAGSTLNVGNPGEAWYLSSDQAHYSTGITTTQVEGGQIFVLHQLAPFGNAQVVRGGFVRDRRTNAYAQQVTITNTGATSLPGPFFLVLDGLSANATLTNGSGTTSAFPPAAPYIQVPIGGSGLASGASANVTLQFANPSNAAISYTTRLINGVVTP